MPGRRGGRLSAAAAVLDRTWVAAAARPPGLIARCVSAVLLIWTTVDVLVGGPWTGTDHLLSDLVRRTGIRATAWPEPLFRAKVGLSAMTRLGDRWVVLGALLPLGGWLAWRHRNWRPVFRVAVAVGLLGATVYLAKVGIGRTNPPIDQLHTPGGRSFPSGHVPTAVLCWGLAAWLAAEYAVPTWLRLGLAVLGRAAPVLIGTGMLLLGYHWFSDLVAGLAAGVLLLSALHGIDAATSVAAGGRSQSSVRR